MVEPRTASDFLSTQRGGGLFTEAVNQRLGAHLAAFAHRRGLAPTSLTLANLALGITGSVLVIATTPWAGPIAAVLWQFAYCLDCADGQLARATGRASAAGARVDILCDVAVQISLVAAVAATASAHVAGLPAWLGPLFAGTWMVNLVTSLLAGGPAGGSLVPSRSWPVRVVKLVRDYGAIVLVCGVVIAFAPRWTGWLMAALCIVNGGFLAAAIAQAAQASRYRR